MSHEIIVDEEKSLAENIDFKGKIKFIYGSAFNMLSVAIIVTDIGEVFLKGNISDYDYENFTKLTDLFNIKFAGCGEDYIILIDDENNLFGCGKNYGQLNYNKNLQYFNKFYCSIQIKEEIKFIRCGSDFTIIVTTNNKILYGGNSDALNGEIDCIRGYKLIENTPQVDIKDIKAGYYHTILLDSFGNVYGSGKNDDGQLGFESSITHVKHYTKLNTPRKVKAIHCTTNGTLLLSYYNEIFLCEFDKNTKGFSKINLSINDGIQTLKFITSNDYNSNILVNNEIYTISFTNGTAEMIKQDFKLTKDWLYKNVVLCGSTTLYIGSDYKINNINSSKKKICNRLYLQQLNKENPFLDLTFCDK
ncbi:hypothetical protein ABK040_008960 [Willaertia magna]